MRRRTIAIIIAVILALAAAGLVVWYVSSVREETTTVEQTQTVLVAKEDIPALTTGEAIIEKGLVERQQVVVSSVVPGALSDETSSTGHGLTIPVAMGQQLLQSQLGVPEEQSLSFEIKQGMRAISVPVDRDNGVGGAIKKGDRVDVIATFEVEDFQQVLLPLGAVLPAADAQRILMSTGIDLTQTVSPVKQDATAASGSAGHGPIVGGDTSSGGGGLSQAESGHEVPDLPVITLMVSPADAEKLVFAQKYGKMWFTLVPAEDTTKVSTPGSALPNLFR